jgi:VanZ family protein
VSEPGSGPRRGFAATGEGTESPRSNTPGAIARWGPVAAWAAVIFLASTSWFSGSHTDSMLRPLLIRLFPAASLQTIDEIHAAIRKAAHFTEYAVFGWLIARALRDARGWQLHHALLAVALAGTYAVSDELHQRFVPGRTAAFGDVLIDTLGAATAQVLIALLWFRRRRR